RPESPTLVPYTTLFRSRDAAEEHSAHGRRFLPKLCICGLDARVVRRAALPASRLSRCEPRVQRSRGSFDLTASRQIDADDRAWRSEEHTSELQSLRQLV